MGKRTRREFLKDSAAAAIAGSLYWSQPPDLFAQQTKQSRVVLIRHKDLLDKQERPRKEIVLKMLDEAVSTLLDEKDAVRRGSDWLNLPMWLASSRTNGSLSAHPRYWKMSLSNG